MLERSAWNDLIPHKGAMALVERVLSFDPDTICAQSDNHRDPAHPLRRDGRLHAVHLCEYGAQAMAVHGALLSQTLGSKASPGLLVTLRDVQLHVDYIEQLPAALTIHAARESADAGAWLYRFRVLHEVAELASGQAMVVLETGQ